MNSPLRPTIARAYTSPVIEDNNLEIEIVATKRRGKAKEWQTLINITFVDSKERIFPVSLLGKVESKLNFPKEINAKAIKDSFWDPMILELHKAVKENTQLDEATANIYRALINSVSSYTNPGKLGPKIHYSSKDEDCPHLFALVFDTETNTLEIACAVGASMKCTCGHEIYDGSRGLSTVQKDLIEELIGLGRSEPRHVKKCCRQRDIAEPTTAQISNYLSYRSAKIHGSTGETILEELEAHVLANSVMPSAEYPDKPFYAASSFNIPEEEFVVLICTRQSLALIQETPLVAHMLHTDAMHQCSSNGCKVYQLGVTDKEKRYLGVGVGVGTHERQREFEVMYRGLCRYARSFVPTFNMSDDCGAIRNAAIAVWATIVTLMCYQHVHKVSDDLTLDLLYILS